MRTIQVTLDDDLVEKLDQVFKESNIDRSAFMQDALRRALTCYREQALVEKHWQGYQRYPVTVEEFLTWEDERPKRTP